MLYQSSRALICSRQRSKIILSSGNTGALYRFLATKDAAPPSAAELNRHTGILLHPDSIGAKILPGGSMVQRTTRSGHVQTRYTELVYGYFWMVKDMRKTNEKPVLANTTALIPESVAKVFPTLKFVQEIKTGNRVEFPAHLVRKNRSRDPSAQCRLVAIAFRDFGFQQLSSWILPFREAFSTSDRVEVVTLNVAEGWLNRTILRPIINTSMRRNTKPDELDSTFLYFGDSSSEQWRDALRMHNLLVGYVVLLDGLGRVRFAASGTATEEELAQLIHWTNELTLQKSSSASIFKKSFRSARPKSASMRPRR